MRKLFRNKLIGASLAVLMLMTPFEVLKVKAEENIAEPSIVAQYGATISLDTGELLYGKNEDVQAYPASITKVMTALLLMENLDEDDEVEIVYGCANITRSSSQAYYEEGEIMDRDTALYSLMVTSANDLACSIGAAIAGSEEEFGKMMTKRAKELGAVNSNFVNASGLDHYEHQTTARDIAIITREAFKHENIRKAMYTKVYEAKTSRQEVSLTNNNKINQDKDTLGGKTGFTNNALNTLVKIDEVDGNVVINVVMKSQLGHVYDDIKAISNFGVEKLQQYEFPYEDEVELFGSKVKVAASEKVTVSLTDEKAKDKVSLEFKVNDSLKESEIVKDGVAKGDILGKVVVKYEDSRIKEYDAVAQEDVTFGKMKSVFEDSGEGMNRSLKALIAMVVPIFGYMLIMILFNKRALDNKRKKK